MLPYNITVDVKVVLSTVFIGKFGCNCFLFQKVAIYNEERQIPIPAAKIKE